jgi:pilus assembly protein CpaF
VIFFRSGTNFEATIMVRNSATETDVLPAVRFQRVKAEVHRRVVESLDLSRLNRWNDERLEREVRKLASRFAADAPGLDSTAKDRLASEVVAEAFGLGPIQPLFDDPEVSDILVNGPTQVFIEKNGRLRETDVVFADNAHIVQLIQRIAARVGRRIDESSPLVDARLADGSRVNAILSPLARTGPTLSIRRFGVRLTTDDLVANGTMPTEVLEFIRAVVESRVSVLISGGTGSGKTTLLNCISKFIPNEERLITVEDTAELKLQRPHVVSLETRPANMEGAGEVRTRDLVRNALRMRPDRIIVGEVRGGEALDMLQAMNTGHEGSMTTIHANDTRDALTRLEAMVMMAGFELPVPVIRHYIATAITVVVQLTRLKGGHRKVTRVSEIVGTASGGYVVNDIFGYRQTGVEKGEAVGEFFTSGYVPRVIEKLRANGVTLPSGLFSRRNFIAEADVVPLQSAPMPSDVTQAASVLALASPPGPPSDPKLISFGDTSLNSRTSVPVPKSVDEFAPTSGENAPPADSNETVITFGGAKYKAQ